MLFETRAVRNECCVYISLSLSLSLSVYIYIYIVFLLIYMYIYTPDCLHEERETETETEEERGREKFVFVSRLLLTFKCILLACIAGGPQRAGRFVYCVIASEQPSDAI